VVARTSLEPTEDPDFLGLELLPLLDQDIAADQQVRFDWAAAKDSAGNVRPPRAYDLFCQSGSGWSYVAPADLLASVDGSLTTVTLGDNTSLGSYTLAAEANSVTIKPALPLAPQPRQNSAAGFNGLAYRPSYAQDCLTQSLTLTVLQGSIAATGWKQLLKWAQSAVPLRLEDADTGAYIKYYYGRLAEADYLASVWKDPRPQHNIKFLVEREERY
jgi:hypothetical protein